MPRGSELKRSRPKRGCSAIEEEKTMPRQQIPKGISRKGQWVQALLVPQNVHLPYRNNYQIST